MRTVSLATLLVATAGIPWALTQWAPFAFIGVEINRLAAGGPATARANGGATYQRVHADDGAGPPSPTALQLDHHGLLGRDEDESGGGDEAGGDDAPTGEMAGIYLGILNFYTAFPQLLGTFIGMIVFAIVEPGKSRELAGAPEGGADGGKLREGVNAIAVCMFLGGLSSLGAAYATWRLRFVR